MLLFFCLMISPFLYASSDGGGQGQIVGFNRADFVLVEHYNIQEDSEKPTYCIWYSKYGIYNIDKCRPLDRQQNFNKNGIIEAFIDPVKLFNDTIDPEGIINIEYYVNADKSRHAWLIQYEYFIPIGMGSSYKVISKKLSKDDYQNNQSSCVMVRYGNKSGYKTPYDDWSAILKPFLPTDFTVLKGSITTTEKRVDELLYRKENTSIAQSLKTQLENAISKKHAKKYKIKLVENSKCNCGLSFVTSKPYVFYKPE